MEIFLVKNQILSYLRKMKWIQIIQTKILCSLPENFLYILGFCTNKNIFIDKKIYKKNMSFLKRYLEFVYYYTTD